MSVADPRWPCPVCLGVTMEKITVGKSPAVTLDCCRRCGGVWFEFGEVQALRGRKPEELFSLVARAGVSDVARCHSCHAHVSRHDDKCPACGHLVTIDCPPCDHPMERTVRGSLTLDVCRKCKGVWFDHHELEQIWKDELGKAIESRSVSGEMTRGDVLAESLMWNPYLMFYGVDAAAHVLAAGAQGLTNAPEAIAGAVDVAGEAAASVFEVIAGIIGELFG